MSLLNNFLLLLGVIQLGKLTHFLFNTLFFYIKWKQWPKSSAELQLEKECEILQTRLEALIEKNDLLTAELTQRQEDIKTIWQKTINRLP